MKQDEMKNYIGDIIENTEIGDIEKEISNAELLLLVYIAGLKREDFPVEFLIGGTKLERDIPAPYHTLVGQIAILKSKYPSPYIMEYLRRNADIFSQILKQYFGPWKN